MPCPLQVGSWVGGRGAMPAPAPLALVADRKPSQPRLVPTQQQSKVTAVIDADEPIMALNQWIGGRGGAALLGVGGAAVLYFGTYAAVGNAYEAHTGLSTQRGVAAALPKARRPAFATPASFHKNRDVCRDRAEGTITELHLKRASNALAAWGTGGMGLSMLVGAGCLGGFSATLAAMAGPLLAVSVPAVVLFGLMVAFQETREVVELLVQRHGRDAGLRRRAADGTSLEPTDPLQLALRRQLEARCWQRVGVGTLEALSGAALAIGVGAGFWFLAGWGLGVMFVGAVGFTAASWLSNKQRAADLAPAALLGLGSKRLTLWEAERQGALAEGAAALPARNGVMAHFKRFFRRPAVAPAAALEEFWDAYVQQRSQQVQKMLTALQASPDKGARNAVRCAALGIEGEALLAEANRLKRSQEPPNVGETLWNILVETRLIEPFVAAAFEGKLLPEVDGSRAAVEPLTVRGALMRAQGERLGKLGECVYDVVRRAGHGDFVALQRACLDHLEARLAAPVSV